MSKIRAIIAGGRDFHDYDQMCKVLNESLYVAGQEIEIISGGAEGADALGEKFAVENELLLHVFPAQWAKEGKQAGYLRNVRMAEYATSDSEYEPRLYAFWNNESRGTKHMIETAQKYGMVIHISPYISSKDRFKSGFAWIKINHQSYIGQIVKRHTNGTYDIELDNHTFTDVPEKELQPINGDI